VKVSFDLSKKIKNNGLPSFKGYGFSKSEEGFRNFEVAFPFDEDRDNCYIEVYTLDKDPYGNYFSTGKAYTKDRKALYQIKSGNNKIDMAKTFGIDDNQPFAFHYVLEDKKDPQNQRVKIDAGDVIDERADNNGHKHLFNIVMPNRSMTSRGGAMKLVIIDSQNVGYVYNKDNNIVFNPKLAERGEKGIKTITNKFGGTLAGLEQDVENGKYDNYDRIISLPIFTDDDFSAHAYWNKNCYQMASSLGNINNYASLQRKLFAHGLNFVSDGAYVNEGLQGVHFKHIAKWGEESPYVDWFKVSGLQDGPLSYGIFVKNKEFISHKLVNAPYFYYDDGSGKIKKEQNYKYDKTKPTYIQFFDSRLVSNEEKQDTQTLIKTYDKMSTDNPYELHDHNDSVYPYAFEIKAELYDKNVERLNEYNRLLKREGKSPLKLNSPLAARLLSKSTFYTTDGKFEGGFETWDANPDIAKLSFSFSPTDSKNLENLSPEKRKEKLDKMLKGNYQVQDYSISSAKYWTQKTDDILRLYVAQNLKNIDKDNPTLTYNNILALADNVHFPKSLKSKISKAEIENVLDGFYNDKRVLSDEDKKSQILEGLMDLPLDSIEFGDNIVSVLASPLVSKRAVTPEEVGLSRYEVYKNGNKNLLPEYQGTYEKTDSIYTNEMSDFAVSVLDNVNSELPEDKKLFDGDEVTEYGKYVLPLLTSEIAKFAVIKSIENEISKNNDETSDFGVKYDEQTGEISYNYDRLKNTYLESLGITNSSSVEEETNDLLSSIKRGMKGLDSSSDSIIVKSLKATLKNTSLEGFKLADLLIDKAQAGLDWRIDATKDIADVEALRCGSAGFEETWNTIIDFWKEFTQGILSKNPNSYIVAEATDEGDLWNIGYGSASSKYHDYSSVINKLKRETGISAIADYSFFFSKVSNMFSKSFETGENLGDGDYPQRILMDLLVGANSQSPLTRSGSLDSLMYAYTFIGNHDKPRALHCTALDMGLFYSDLTKPESKNCWEYRKKAIQILEDRFMDNISDWEIEHYRWNSVSPKAIAMADALRPKFIDVLNEYKFNNVFSSEEEFNKKAFEPISKAISDLARGEYLGQSFNPEAFGVKPIDVNIAMVLNQAKNVYGFELPNNLEKDLENKVFENIMTPAIKKVLAMMKVLVALPGMPTLFDGDDAGATGYDTKTKNMFLQGRQRIHNEWFDDVDNDKYKSFIASYKKEFDDVMSVRKNQNCTALNNGGVFPLKMQMSQEGYKVPAVFRQNTDGQMTISLFNTSNLNTGNDCTYQPRKIYVNRIYLDEEYGAEHTGIAGLKYDTEFRNVDKSDKGRYFVKIDAKNGKHYITRVYGNRDVPTPIEDTTLILYSVPKDNANNVPFTGRFLTPPASEIIARNYNNLNDCTTKRVLTEV
jgi:hypothetical protein